MSSDFDHIQQSSPRLPLIFAVSLLFAQLLIIGTLFKHTINFTCLGNWPAYACSGASGSMIAVYCICGALALFAFLFRTPVALLFEDAGQRYWPLAINLLGAALTMVPMTFLVEGSGTTYLTASFTFWGVGLSLILAGLMLYLAPVPRWGAFISTEKWRLGPLLIGGALAPLLASLIQPIWKLDWIASTTFSAVAAVIQTLGYDVEVRVDERVIGANNFFIDIAPVCSGVEGIALVTIFISLYFFLFKSELRFPRALILYPLGILASASLNIVRIVILLVIGLEGNPALAIGGFHSHAGWIMFSLVSLGIIWAANTASWLRKPVQGATLNAQKQAIQPFFKDPFVAMILPFAVFMFSAMLAQAFSQTPSVIYPARAAFMAAALWLFVPVYKTLHWRVDPVTVAVGAAIGLMWIVIPVTVPDKGPPYGALTSVALAFWFVARGIGTIVLVPIIEELFFRGYLEQKLKRQNTTNWAFFAALGTAVIFAALHGRWVEAFIASLAFSYVMHRSGKVTDAIIAHGIANAIVFVFALLTQKLYII